MICEKCKQYFKSPGQVKGGQKSRRMLTPEQARKMVEAREKKRALQLLDKKENTNRKGLK